MSYLNEYKMNEPYLGSTFTTDKRSLVYVQIFVCVEKFSFFDLHFKTEWV